MSVTRADGGHPVDQVRAAVTEAANALNARGLLTPTRGELWTKSMLAHYRKQLEIRLNGRLTDNEVRAVIEETAHLTAEKAAAVLSAPGSVEDP